MNTITLVGTLGRDPEVVTAASGNVRTRLRVAVTKYMGPDKEEKTHWVDVTAFGSLGENVANSLKKGHRVIIMGELDTYNRDVQIDGEDKTIGQVAFVASGVGPDLRWQEADVRKGATGNGGGQRQQSAPAQRQSAPAAKAAPAAAAPADDDF